jgi:hypothetical protein
MSQTVTCKGLAPVTEGHRNEAFAALTKTSWTLPYCASGYASQCTTIRLEPGGTYQIATTGTTGGYGGGPNAPPPPREDSGSWNFASTDGESGVVCLDGATASPMTADGEVNLPSALAFKFGTTTVYPPPGGGSSGTTGEQIQLTLGGYTLLAEVPITDVGSADALPDIHVPEGFARLVGKTWRKASSFDPVTVPATLSFDALGRLTETYDGPACAQTGPMSWDKDTMLFASQQSCSSYPYYSQPSQVPDFLDDLFVFSNGVFRSGALANAKNEFVFDPYGHAVHVHGSFDGTLHVGVATNLDLTFTNVDAGLLRQLESLTVSIVPAKLSYGTQYTTTGVAATQLATRDYGSLVLPAGQSHSDTLAITPPASGDTFALTFEIKYKDATKDYDGMHSFITAVSP